MRIRVSSHRTPSLFEHRRDPSAASNDVTVTSLGKEPMLEALLVAAYW